MTEQSKNTKPKTNATAARTSATEATGRAANAAGSAKGAGIKGVEAGRQALEAASGKVAATASTAWVLLNSRKAAIAGAGAVALGAASFVAGRRVEQRSRGPLVRLLAGRN
ncbi:hypothetical protein J7I98_08885 [Streptomyces sp. ISL-98]|uniref:hypothetical protein n=1 Tax=Streptomyces sp. ISL-98 TaxID=2819192 RepID=UPI001BE70C81|nr:hypothetical protein [Streptomyces sp. ISL-98]MBT2506007.1 hypothetical protein [Streptomyces sp. ISL-98]